MATYGWGLLSAELHRSQGRPPWYRWDQYGSSTYWYRPDHTIEAYIEGRKAMRGIVPDIASYALLNLPRGRGGPSGTTPTSTVSSKRRQGRASAEHGKRGRTPSLGKESRARRKSCPKGHYWSYKKKKCMKSKY